MSALTMLNEKGDTTIVWTPDRDDEMEAIIQKKLDEGCTFFIIEPRFGTREKLKQARDGARHRVLAIPDEDFAKFVGSGSGEAVASPQTPIVVKGKAKTAKQAAAAELVGVKPRRGG